MEISPQKIDGFYLIRHGVHADSRGTFCKPFHKGTFAANGLETDFAEMFTSTSCKDVIRGMHYQIEAGSQAKLVSCLHGRILDVILDLRPESPTYGTAESLELSAGAGVSCYLAPGLAHGFLTLTDGAMVAYLTSTMHDPLYDTGVRWDSFGFDWPVAAPILSDRDRALPSL